MHYHLLSSKDDYKKKFKYIYMLGESEGATPERSHKNENKSPTHKAMTPPSTQNLKTLSLWVFFLIYVAQLFSFLPNVGLRLTLEYLPISLSNESLSSTLIHSPSSGSPYLYRRSHTYTGHACLKSPSRRLSIQGQTKPIRPVTKTDHQLWCHLLGKFEGGNLGRSHKNENWVNPHRGMSPPSTQNLKALGL